MGNRLIVVILFYICISVNMNAKDYFATLIENFDVDDVTMTQDNTHPVAFWNSLVQNSMNVEELLMNMGKKRGAEREALEVLGTLPRYDKEFRPDAMDELQPLCDSIFAQVGIIDKIDRCIVADETVNAFTAYSSDGMVVGVNVGLLNAKGMSDPILFGVIAHEYAHALLFHHLRQIYDNIKRRKKEDVLKGLTVAVVTAGEVASTYSDAMNGFEHSRANFENQLYHIEKSYHDDLRQYYFKYSRDLEYEADLIAYRFLEWSGYGGDNYIRLLKLLGANNPESYIPDENSDHPTIHDRIAFINYAKEHKELKNKRNGKLKKRHSEMSDNHWDPLYY